MTDSLLMLYCVIDGESASNAFEVEVQTTTTIAELKTLIVDGKQAPAFKGIAPKDLTLWRASIPDENQGLAVAIDSLVDKTELHKPRTRLSELFPESPDDNTYIVVRRPPRGNVDMLLRSFRPCA